MYKYLIFNTELHLMNIQIYIAEKEDDEDSEGKKSHVSHFSCSGSLLKQH